MVAISVEPARPAEQAARKPRAPALFAILVTAMAGYLDAIGYVQLNHLYVSFMSGNTTHLGMSIAAHNWSDVAIASLVIGAFVIGSFAGTAVADRAGERQVVAVLGSEFAILVAAVVLAFFGSPRGALVVVAAAMGMQNAVHQVIAGADIGRSFITGALFGLGRALARALVGKGSAREAFAFAASWLAFVAGVVAGSVVLGYIGLLASLTVIAAMLAWVIVFVDLRLL